MKRRKEIEKALGEVGESPSKWSRNEGTRNHLFMRKRIKPETITDIAPLNQIKVIAYKEKGEWILETKYNIGKKKTQD